MSYQPLGQKILQLRSQLGLTQKELAKRMRTSQQAISRLERGEYIGYTLRTLVKLARATGTELIVDFRSEGNTAEDTSRPIDLQLPHPQIFVSEGWAPPLGIERSRPRDREAGHRERGRERK